MKRFLTRSIFILALSSPIFDAGKTEAGVGGLADDAIRAISRLLKSDDTHKFAGPLTRRICIVMPFLYEKPVFTAQSKSLRGINCPWEVWANIAVIISVGSLSLAGLMQLYKENK